MKYFQNFYSVELLSNGSFCSGLWLNIVYDFIYHIIIVGFLHLSENLKRLIVLYTNRMNYTTNFSIIIYKLSIK